MMTNNAKNKKRVIRREKPVVLVAVERGVRLLTGIAEQAEEYGWGLLDLNITRGSRLPGVTPIGLLTGSLWDTPLVRDTLAEGIKVVRVGHFPAFKGDLIVPAVIQDMRRAAHMAADHFAERGFKHLAYVGNYPGENPWYNAFLDRAEKRGCNSHLLQVKPASIDLPGDIRLDNKKQQIGEWLVEMPKPLGILTYNDRNAVTIFATAKVIGLEIPESVSLLGLGNDPATCPFFPVPLSSIDMDDENWGRQAVKLLKKLVDGEPSKSPLLVSPKGVVERQSTNLLAVSDPVVGRALRFIWDNYREQMSIDDVAAAGGVARSTICRKFKQCLGRGVNAELRRKRLEHCTRLLRTTHMTVEDILAVSGFFSKAYLFRAFRKTFGMTPREYRNQEHTRR